MLPKGAGLGFIRRPKPNLTRLLLHLGYLPPCRPRAVQEPRILVTNVRHSANFAWACSSVGSTATAFSYSCWARSNSPSDRWRLALHQWGAASSGSDWMACSYSCIAYFLSAQIVSKLPKYKQVNGSSGLSLRACIYASQAFSTSRRLRYSPPRRW